MNSEQKKALRKKLYVNREVQGDILLRSVVHWCFYMVAILLAVVVWTAVRDPSQVALKLVFESFVYFSPGIVASVVLLPVFIYDILKASHRTAGPIIRLKAEMAKLANGENVDELRFRDGDNWADMADEFNNLAEQVMAERKLLKELNQQRELEAVLS